MRKTNVCEKHTYPITSYNRIYQIWINIVREKTSNLSYESLTRGVLSIPPQILRAKCVKNKDINIYKKLSFKFKKLILTTIISA